MNDITTLKRVFVQGIHSWPEHFLYKLPSLLNPIHPFSQAWSWSTHFSSSTYILLITFFSSPSYLSLFTISAVWWLSPSPRLRSRWGLSLLPGSESQFVVCVMYVWWCMKRGLLQIETCSLADRNMMLSPQKSCSPWNWLFSGNASGTGKYTDKPLMRPGVRYCHLSFRLCRFVVSGAGLSLLRHIKHYQQWLTKQLSLLLLRSVLISEC